MSTIHQRTQLGDSYKVPVLREFLRVTAFKFVLLTVDGDS